MPGQSGGLDPGGVSTGDFAATGELAVRGVVAADPIQGDASRASMPSLRGFLQLRSVRPIVGGGGYPTVSDVEKPLASFNGPDLLPLASRVSILGLPGSGF